MSPSQSKLILYKHHIRYIFINPIKLGKYSILLLRSSSLSLSVFNLSTIHLGLLTHPPRSKSMGAEGESTQSVPTAATDEESVQINVRCSNGAKFSVQATLRSTVLDFKQLVSQNCDVPAVQQRLIYKGRILKDDQTLDSYGMQLLCSIVLFPYFVLLILWFCGRILNLCLLIEMI